MRETMAVAPIMIDPWMTKPNHMMKTTAPMPSEMLMVSWASTPILVAMKRSDEVTKKLSSCSRNGQKAITAICRGRDSSAQAGACRLAAYDAFSCVPRTHRWAV